MMKIQIFLFLCIYNLQLLTYNQIKPFIESLTRSSSFSVISKLCMAAIKDVDVMCTYMIRFPNNNAVEECTADK